MAPLTNYLDKNSKNFSRKDHKNWGQVYLVLKWSNKDVSILTLWLVLTLWKFSITFTCGYCSPNVYSATNSKYYLNMKWMYVGTNIILNNVHQCSIVHLSIKFLCWSFIIGYIINLQYPIQSRQWQGKSFDINKKIILIKYQIKICVYTKKQEQSVQLLPRSTRLTILVKFCRAKAGLLWK